MVTIPVSMYQTVVSNVNQYQNIQVAMASSAPQHNGDVPDATHAVEIMTVEPTSVTWHRTLGRCLKWIRLHVRVCDLYVLSRDCGGQLGAKCRGVIRGRESDRHQCN